MTVLLQDIFERDAFRVVFLKPRLCGVLAREDFKVILIANLLVSIDIDRNSHWSFSAFASPMGFFTIRIELANQCRRSGKPDETETITSRKFETTPKNSAGSMNPGRMNCWMIGWSPPLQLTLHQTDTALIVAGNACSGVTVTRIDSCSGSEPSDAARAIAKMVPHESVSLESGTGPP